MPSDSATVPGADPGARRLPADRVLLRSALLLVVGVAVVLAAYLAFAIPGRWFPSAVPVAFGARDLQVTRGSGRLAGDELLVTATDPGGTTIVSVTTDLRSSDYPAVAWIVSELPPDATATLLWRSDVSGATVNQQPLRIEGGRTVVASMQGEPKWIGRIKGLALTVHVPGPQPYRVRGVVAKTAGAGELLADRVYEWTAFESWSGASINAVTGGADFQDLPLTLVVAVAIIVAALLGLGWRLARKSFSGSAAIAFATTLFLLGWAVLDARWAANLARQSAATATQYAGKSLRERILSDEDGPVYAFVEKVRALLPATPARVFVVSDVDYFRDRAAYHLYPNNVFFRAVSNELPNAADLRPGDWLVVYQRRGIQYAANEKRLRWGTDQAVGAELKLLESGGALFLIQ